MIINKIHLETEIKILIGSLDFRTLSTILFRKYSALNHESKISEVLEILYLIAKYEESKEKNMEV